MGVSATCAQLVSLHADFLFNSLYLLNFSYNVLGCGGLSFTVTISAPDALLALLLAVSCTSDQTADFSSHDGIAGFFFFDKKRTDEEFNFFIYI